MILRAAPSYGDEECRAGDAKRVYASARDAFEAKRYDDSIALLRRAYACDPNPIYLQNIARAYEESNRPREALDAWRRYGEANVPDAQATRGRISVLEKMVEELDRLEREKAAAAAAARDAEARTRSTPKSAPPRAPSVVLPFIVTGAGVAVVGAGIGLGIVAESKHDDAVLAREAERSASLQDDAKTMAIGANVLLTAGMVAAVVGASWLVWTIRAPSSSAAAAPYSCVGGVASWTCSF